MKDQPTSTPCIQSITKQYHTLFTKHDLSDGEHTQFKVDLCNLMNSDLAEPNLSYEKILSELEEYYNNVSEQEQKELISILQLPFTDKCVQAEPIKIDDAKLRNDKRHQKIVDDNVKLCEDEALKTLVTLAASIEGKNHTETLELTEKEKDYLTHKAKKILTHKAKKIMIEVKDEEKILPEATPELSKTKTIRNPYEDYFNYYRDQDNVCQWYPAIDMQFCLNHNDIYKFYHSSMRKLGNQKKYSLSAFRNKKQQEYRIVDIEKIDKQLSEIIKKDHEKMIVDNDRISRYEEIIDLLGYWSQTLAKEARDEYFPLEDEALLRVFERISTLSRIERIQLIRNIRPKFSRTGDEIEIIDDSLFNKNRHIHKATCDNKNQLFMLKERRSNIEIELARYNFTVPNERTKGVRSLKSNMTFKHIDYGYVIASAWNYLNEVEEEVTKKEKQEQISKLFKDWE